MKYQLVIILFIVGILCYSVSILFSESRYPKPLGCVLVNDEFTLTDSTRIYFHKIDLNSNLKSFKSLLDKNHIHLCIDNKLFLQNNSSLFRATVYHEQIHILKLKENIYIDSPTALMVGFLRMYWDIQTLNTKSLTNEFKNGNEFAKLSSANRYRLFRDVVNKKILTIHDNEIETIDAYLKAAFLSGFLYGFYKGDENLIFTALTIISLGGVFEHIECLVNYPYLVNRINDLLVSGDIMSIVQNDKEITRPYEKYGAMADLLKRFIEYKNLDYDYDWERFVFYNLFKGAVELYSENYKKAMSIYIRNFSVKTYSPVIWGESFMFWNKAFSLCNTNDFMDVSFQKLDSISTIYDIKKTDEVYFWAQRIIENDAARNSFDRMPLEYKHYASKSLLQKYFENIKVIKE